ncbi:Splicing factor U2af large subunit B [Acorus calamus]|uniref:Splicing factor U2af large subunit B n=1 Tax=Acorus calamus TaxID=4465 RepID=A0AAV9ENK7_ACOCL|nr:Splicing factor U2af large subunit B [Acorus calamus]
MLYLLRLDARNNASSNPCSGFNYPSSVSILTPARRESSERSKTRERERYRDRDRDRDRYGRDQRRERNVKEERGRDKYDDHDRHRSRDSDRLRDHDRDRDRKHRHRSRSPSQSKSKRTSGFDMAPPGATSILPTVAVPGQLPGVPQTMPGILPPNAFHFPSPQFGAIPIVPAQAMTQQATRHARRVYVGGLPPLANEQTIATFFSHVMSAIGGNTAGPEIDENMLT